MATRLGGTVLGADGVEHSATRAGALLGPAGGPLVLDPVMVARRLEQMVTTDGEPLFPHIDARVVAEDEEFLAWQRTAAWQVLEPGPELAYELSTESLDQLPAGGVVEIAKAHARLIAHHEALLAEALAELASRPEYTSCGGPHQHDPVKAAASEVSLALSWTPAYADTRVRDAVTLATKLPATLDALHQGRIDAYRARVICDETRPLDDDPEQRAAVERAALQVAGSKTGPALRAYVKREVLRRAPEHAEQRRRNARRAPSRQAVPGVRRHRLHAHLRPDRRPRRAVHRRRRSSPSPPRRRRQS